MKAKISKGFKNVLLPLMMIALTAAQPVYSAVQAPSSQVIRVGISNTAFSSWVRNTVEIYGTEEVNIYDITDISDYKVKYLNEKGKTIELKYERGAAIIYNGVSTKTAFNTSIFV